MRDERHRVAGWVAGPGGRGSRRRRPYMLAAQYAHPAAVQVDWSIQHGSDAQRTKIPLGELAGSRILKCVIGRDDVPVQERAEVGRVSGSRQFKPDGMLA